MENKPSSKDGLRFRFYNVRAFPYYLPPSLFFLNTVFLLRVESGVIEVSVLRSVADSLSGDHSLIRAEGRAGLVSTKGWCGDIWIGLVGAECWGTVLSK